MTGIETLAAIPRLHALRSPQRIALSFNGRSTSYLAWNQRCNQVANALSAAGLAPGARVAYLGKNSDRFFDVLFGAAMARMVTVPLNWRLAPPELQFIVDDAQCRVLFVGGEYLSLVPALRAACPSLLDVVSVEGEAAGSPSIDTWLTGAAVHEPTATPAVDEVALQLYTSGTTGSPKGAQLTHANLLFATRLAGRDELGCWREDDVSVLPLPLFHAGGIAYGLNGPYWGATTVVVPDASPASILRAMRDTQPRATRLGVVPSVLQTLLDHPEFDTKPFSALRTLTYGGSPIPPAVVRRATEAFGPVLTQLFGMTETATVGTILLPADHDSGDLHRLTSCGRALPGVEVCVVREDGTPAAVGESGEIRIRCGAVMCGYWNRPQADVEALRDGWYCTGDAGYLDSQGYLTIQDRIKDMIISGGENIYPAEVERVLSEHPLVVDVAVIGVPDAKWGETVKAIVVQSAGAALDASALVCFARERLAGYKCPTSVDFVKQLPRNATGKLLKRVLREPYWAGQARKVS